MPKSGNGYRCVRIQLCVINYVLGLQVRACRRMCRQWERWAAWRRGRVVVVLGEVKDG